MKKTLLPLILTVTLLSNITISYAQGNQPFWKITGNTNISSENFIGTLNYQDLVFKTNNTQRMLIQENGLILFKDKVTGEYPVRLKSKLTVDGIALFKDKATFNGIGHFKNKLIADDITRLKSKLIVDSNAVIKGKIRNNYLSGSGIVLLKANNNGVIKKFLFPGDSTKVLRGDGTYGSFSAGITGSENNTVYFNQEGKQQESDALTNDGTDIKVKNNLTVGERSGATGAYSMVVGASAPEYGLAAPEASNLGAFAHGSGTKATGLASFSTGVATKATGMASFSTGINTIASGESSFAGGHDDAGGNRFVVASGKGAFNYSAIGNDYVKVGAAAKNSAILGGKDNSIDTLAENSGIFCGRNNTILISPTQAPPLQTVIIGGENIIATEANTVYVPDLIAKGSITAENMNVTGQTVFDSLKVSQLIKVGNTINIGGTEVGLTNKIFDDSNDLLIQSETGSNYNTIINANNEGKVGIGTNNPQTKLHIFSNDNPTCGTQLRIEYLSTATPNGCPGSSVWDLNAQGGGILTFQNYSTSNSVMTLTKDGNVGIGTNTPEATLDVNGSVFIQGKGGTWTNSHWNVILTSNLGSCWRLSEPNPHTGHYLGFGMTNITDEPGWYWIASTATDDSQNPKYPMYLRIDNSGNGHLNVCGTIKAKEIIVDETDGCDYVFEDDYKRMTPEEKAKYYKEKKHLFGLPSAKEIEKNGLKIGKTMSGLTLNVEELSLDLIDLYKIIIEQKKEIEQLKKRLEILEQK